MNPVGRLEETRQSEFIVILRSLKKDLLMARARGVTWEKIAELLAAKTGYRLSGKDLGARVRSITKEQKPAAEAMPITKPEPKAITKPAPAPQKKMYSCDFIIAAVTPDGNLYQLERTGKSSRARSGACAVHSVTADGNLRVCTGTDFPCPTNSKEEAIRRFRDWSRDKGYEIYGEA
jgi:hypothetical protein